MIGYGIDFGTTNSIIALCAPEEREPITRLTDADDRPHPSVIWYHSGAMPVVGREAKLNINAWAGEGANVFVSSIKRQLGRGLVLDILSERKQAWEVASDILSYLLSCARQRGKDVREAVITIPIHFDGRARRDLRRAADRAGLHINTFVHEPFAAVVGHLYQHGGRPALTEWEGKTVLVFDWGGGTLDITVARVTDVGLVELATGGFPGRSGDHFDEMLVNTARGRTLEQEGLSDEDMRLEPNKKDKILYECELAKIALSQDTNAMLQLMGAFRTNSRLINLEMSITREQFEQEIAPTVDSATAEVEKVLKEASLTPRQVDEVLLIGGTSYIPLVRERLRVYFGHRITHVAHADTIIAEGAAIIAAHGLQPFLARTIAISLSDGSHFPIFRAGRPALANACNEDVNLFCTDPRDGLARLVVEESDKYSDTRDFRTKKVLPIPVSANLDKRYRPERVTVRFELNQDLILCVTGKGATQSESGKRSIEIEDLCFGLTLGKE